MITLDIVFKSSSYGMIKYNEIHEDLSMILSLFLVGNSSLLFSFYERNLHLYNVTTQDFILNRCVFVNSEWVLPWAETIPHWDELNTPPKIIWFSVTKKEDILQAIKIDHLFRCVVIEQGKDFQQHSNVLFHEEYYSTGDEDYDYYLGFTNKHDFLNKTLPKIKEKFNVSIS